MIKSVDYTKQHELIEARIAARCKEQSKEHAPEKFHFLEQIIETELRQYRYIKDQEKRKRVETRYYPLLCELAKAHGSRVQLNIDEKYYYASLTYIGKDLILDNSAPIEMNYFIQMFKDCDTVSFETENNQISIQFTFEMHHKEKVKDNTQALKQLKDAYKSL